MSARIITFYNFKGGVGKTSLGFNYAVGRGLMHKRVLYVDLDPQCNSTKRFGYDAEKELSDPTFFTVKDLFGFHNEVLGDTQCMELEDIVRKTPYFGVYLLPGSTKLETYWTEDDSRSGNTRDLLNVLEDYRDDYDYIIMETGPTVGVIARNALFVTDYIMIPTEIARFAFDGIESFYKGLWQQLKRSGSDAQVLGIVVNKYEKNLEKDLLSELVPIATRCGFYLFHSRINKSSAISKADSSEIRAKAKMERDLSVFDNFMVKTYPSGARDIHALSREMEERMDYLESTLNL